MSRYYWDTDMDVMACLGGNKLTKDRGEVFLCKIRNVLMEEGLKDDSKTIEERIRSIAPISATCATYFSWDGKSLGAWGTPKGDFRPGK